MRYWGCLQAAKWEQYAKCALDRPHLGFKLPGLSWLLVPEWCGVFSWCQLYMVYSILPSQRTYKLTGGCLLLSSTVFPSRDCRNTQGAVQGFCKGSAESTSSMTQPWNDSAVSERVIVTHTRKMGGVQQLTWITRKKKICSFFWQNGGQISSPIFVALSLLVSVIYF